MGYAIIWNNIIAETVALCCMTSFMINQCLLISSGKVILCRDRILLSHINPFLRNLFLFRISKVLLCETKVFSKSDNIYSFSVLWNSKIHCINNLRLWYDIPDLI